MRRVVVWARVALACVIGLSMAAPVRAQGDRASISGLVQDSSGAVLPGVTGSRQPRLD